MPFEIVQVSNMLLYTFGTFWAKLRGDPFRSFQDERRQSLSGASKNRKPMPFEILQVSNIVLYTFGAFWAKLSGDPFRSFQDERRQSLSGASKKQNTHAFRNSSSF